MYVLFSTQICWVKTLSEYILKNPICVQKITVICGPQSKMFERCSTVCAPFPAGLGSSNVSVSSDSSNEIKIWSECEEVPK